MGAEERAYMGGGKTVHLDPVEDRPVDGAELLDLVLDFLTRFVAYPSLDAAIAHTLWIAHTHLMAEWTSTPRLAFLSPEPGSGKTRALEVTETLVPRPVASINATPAYLFRKVSDKDGRPTILYDEIDTLFGPRAKDNEEVRGLINAGHRRGATAGRCVVRGKVIETEELPAYCAVALAGIGNLPDTIISRSVVVRMRRRAPSENVDAYRARVHAPEGNAIRDLLIKWAVSVYGIGEAWPVMPEGVTDRNADVWEPLLAVADAVGGAWPERARVSAVSLVSALRRDTPSLGLRLLTDLRILFDDLEAIHTPEILSALWKLDESPWHEMKNGKSLNSTGLANILRPYDIRPKQVRIGGISSKGYRRMDIKDAWDRYLPPSQRVAETPETNETDDEGTP
jgi:hypothetical protein